MKIRENIYKFWRGSHDQREIADMLKVSYQLVQKWEKDKHADGRVYRPHQKHWGKLMTLYNDVTLQDLLDADAGELTVDQFIARVRERKHEERARSTSENKSVLLNTLSRVPVIRKIPNGVNPVEYIKAQRNDSDVIAILRRLSQSAFAWEVDIDTMEPFFIKGDLVIVDPEIDARHGDYVLAMVDGGMTFKQLIKDGATTYLKPSNKIYPMTEVTDPNFKIVGVVIEKRSTFR